MAQRSSCGPSAGVEGSSPSLSTSHGGAGLSKLAGRWIAAQIISRHSRILGSIQKITGGYRHEWKISLGPSCIAGSGALARQRIGCRWGGCETDEAIREE